jgi:hypothetical protein
MSCQIYCTGTLIVSYNLICQRSIVTLAGSKLDFFKSYYCEKSENLHSSSLILYVSSIMAKAQSHNVNNGLVTYKPKQDSNSCRVKVTSANIVGQGRRVKSDP